MWQEKQLREDRAYQIFLVWAVMAVPTVNSTGLPDLLLLHHFSLHQLGTTFRQLKFCVSVFCTCVSKFGNLLGLSSGKEMQNKTPEPFFVKKKN